MAPEILQGIDYNHKADIWSLGCLFYEMLTGFSPFTGRDQRNLGENIKLGTYWFPKTLKLSLEGLSFLESCLQYDQSKRMDWHDLLLHSYIQFAYEAKESEDELCLSYCQKTGNYSDQHKQVLKNPYQWMKTNSDKVVELNVRDG